MISRQAGGFKIMQILVVGSGGREHALIWKISQSPMVDAVIAMPGSDAIETVEKCRCIPISDVKGITATAKQEKADLAVIGPEAPLVEGLADALAEQGIPVFGPTKAAALLEGSKIFSKEFMVRANIPTAAFSTHDNLDSAIEEIRRRNGPMVVKADGLAAGKGVIVCADAKEAEQAARQILSDRAFGEAGAKILIEDMLKGEEASILAICDGKTCIPLVAAQDHKAAFEGDTGPNTGGMGAYAPAPVVTENTARTVLQKVLLPTVRQMEKEGTPFVGILYAGIMLVDGEPFVLEFNVRFGDPECQPLLMLLEEDIVPLMQSAAAGNLPTRPLKWHEGATMCVVLAAEGYPGAYRKNDVICGLEAAAEIPDVMVFHAGTKKQDGRFVTVGGRVLGVTARGRTLKQAADTAYRAASLISWQGMRMRKDIGYRAL
jgi:phosphoribosylamine---glycine ligase